MAVIRKKHTYLRTFTRRKEREKGNRFAKFGLGVAALVPIVYLIKGRGFERLHDFLKTFAEASYKKEARASEASLWAYGPLDKIKKAFMDNPFLSVLGTVTKKEAQGRSVREVLNKLKDIVELLREYYSVAEIRKLFNEDIVPYADKASKLIVEEEKQLLYRYQLMFERALQILTRRINEKGWFPWDPFHFRLLSKYLPHSYKFGLFYGTMPSFSAPLFEISTAGGQFAQIFQREIKNLSESEVLLGQHIEQVIKDYVNKHVVVNPEWELAASEVFKHLSAEEHLQVRNLVTRITEQVAKWLHRHAGIDATDLPDVQVVIKAQRYYDVPILVAQLSVVDLRGVKRSVEIKLGVPQKSGLMAAIGNYPTANVRFAQGNRVRSIFSLKLERLGEMFEHALNDLYEGKSEDYVTRRIHRIIGRYDLYGTGRNDKAFQLVHSIVDKDFKDYAAYSAKKRFLKRAAELILGVRKGKYRLFMDAEWVMAGISSTGTQYAVTESRRRLIWSFAIQVFDDLGNEVDKLVVFIDPKTISDEFFMSQVRRFGLSKAAAEEALRAVRGRVAMPAGYVRVGSEMEASRLICKKIKDIINKYGKDDLLVMGKNFWSSEVALLERAFKADSSILNYIKRKLVDIEDIYRLVYGAKAINRSLSVEAILDYVKVSDEGSKLLGRLLNYEPKVEVQAFANLVRSLHFGEQDNRIAYILSKIAESMVNNDPELRERVLRIYDIVAKSQGAVLSFTTQQEFMQQAYNYVKEQLKSVGVGSPNAARKWRFEYPFNPADWVPLFVPTLEKQRYQLGRGLPLSEASKRLLETLKKEYARRVLGLGEADINYLGPALISMPFKRFLEQQMLYNVRSVFTIPVFSTFFPFAGEGHMFIHRRLTELSTVVQEVISQKIPISRLENMDARMQLWTKLFESAMEAIKTSPRLGRLIEERFNNDIVRFLRALDLSIVIARRQGWIKDYERFADVLTRFFPEFPIKRFAGAAIGGDLKGLTIKQYLAMRAKGLQIPGIDVSDILKKIVGEKYGDIHPLHEWLSDDLLLKFGLLDEVVEMGDARAALLREVFDRVAKSGLHLTNPEQYIKYGTFVMTDRLQLGDKVVKIGYNGKLVFNKVITSYDLTGTPSLDFSLTYEIILTTPLKWVTYYQKGMGDAQRWSLSQFPYYLIEPARFMERGELGIFIETEMTRLKEALIKKYGVQEAANVMSKMTKDLNDYMNRVVNYAIKEHGLPIKLTSPLFMFNPKMMAIEGNYDLFNTLTTEQKGLLWTVFLEGLPEKVGKIGGYPSLFDYLEAKFKEHGVVVTPEDRKIFRRYVQKQYALYKSKKISEKEFFEKVLLKDIADERIRNWFSRLYYGDDREQLARLFDIYQIKLGKRVVELIGLGRHSPFGLGDTALTSTYKSFVRIPMQMYWDIHRWPHLEGMAQFVDAFQAQNLPIYETLLKMADMLKMSQSSIDELVKAGDIYAVPVRRFFDFVRKHMNLLRLVREDIYVPEKILEEAHGDMVQAVQMMLDLGVSLTDFKENAIKFEGAQLRAQVAKEVQDFLRQIFEEAQGKRVVIDVGRAMSVSYKNLESMIGQNDAIIRDLIKYLEKMGYNKLKYIPLGTREFWDLSFHQIGKDQVIVEPQVKKLLQLMASIASIRGKVQATGVPSAQVKFEERNVFYKQFVDYLGSIASNFIGRQSLWARTAVTHLPGVEGVGLPSFLLFNKSRLLDTVVWEPFTTYVDASVIENLKGMLEAAGFSKEFIDAFYKGSPNVAFLGMPGRMPFHPGMGLIGLIKSLTQQQKQRVSSVSDAVKIYMDPLLITKVLLGDWDTDRLMALLTMTSPKGAGDVTRIWKWVYGLSDQDVAFLMSYGKFKAGDRKAIGELQTFFTSVFEKMTKEQKEAYIQSKEFEDILHKRLSAVVAKMKEGYLSWFGKSEAEELSKRIEFLVTGDVTKIPTTEGEVIYLPTILAQMRGYTMKIEKMWPFIQEAKEIARKEGIPFKEALAKHMADIFANRELRNVAGTSMAGKVDVIRTGYALLLQHMYLMKTEGVSYQDMSRIMGLSIPEAFGQVFDKWMAAGAEGQKMILTFEREILDKVLKMKRGGSPEVMAEAINNLANELLEYSKVSSSVAKKGHELIDKFVAEIDWEKMGLKPRDALYMMGWLLRNTQWAIRNSSYLVTRQAINRGLIEAYAMFASRLLSQPTGPTVGPTLLDALSNEVLRGMAKEPKPLNELLGEQTANMRFREALAGFLIKTFDNLSKSRKHRLLLAGALAGIAGYILSGPKLRGDIFSFGIDLGTVHGLEPSFFDGRWTYPELPRGEDIRGLENPYHKRKIYILRNIRRRNPALFNELRRRGIIQEWEMSAPYDYPHRERKVIYV